MLVPWYLLCHGMPREKKKGPEDPVRVCASCIDIVYHKYAYV